MTNKSLSFIVKRLCLQKRNKGIVHIISIISLAGIAVGCFALIVVLSVFNGFTSIAQTMLEKTNPPILISALKGKTIDYNDVKKIKQIKTIKAIIPTIEQTALITVGKNQSIVKMIGIDDSYFKYNHLDTALVNGKEYFRGIDSVNAIMGIDLAISMGLNKGSELMNMPIKITVPKKNSGDAIVVEDKFNSVIVRYCGCYATHSDLDQGYIFVPINKAKTVLDYNKNSITHLYIIPKDKNKIEYNIKKIKQLTDNKYKVANILQQQPIYFKIVKSEKLAVYIILSLIIFIAAINIISSIIILFIQKQRMNYILRAMGMMKKDIKKIYFYYGLTLNAIGCAIGLIVGLIFCVLQQQLGIIKLSAESYVVNSFPIEIKTIDIIQVIIIVLVIGFISNSAIVRRLNIK